MKLEQDEPVTIVLTSEGVGIDDLVQNWNTNMIAVLSAPSVTSSCQVRVFQYLVYLEHQIGVPNGKVAAVHTTIAMIHSCAG